MADVDEREEELSSITAIFPELVVQPDDPFSASIELPVVPLSPLAISFPALDGAPPQTLPTPPVSDSEGPKYNLGPRVASKEVHQLAFLPPLKLQITLPEGYPAVKPPQFTLSARANWVPESVLNRLLGEGEFLWEEYGRGQVVFAYIDSLQQSAERCFDMASDDDNKALEMPGNMKIELLDFDMQAKRRKFEQETFDCGVCLEPKKGSACYRIQRCGHVFCIGCLQDFYNSCISEGDVSSVKCVDPGCGKEGDGKKKDRTLSPSELLHIPIDKAMVQRYAELKRKKKIESDKDTIYCPRSWCQGFARSSKHPKITDLTQVPDSDSESDTEDASRPGQDEVDKTMERASRLTICEECEYAFCRVCLAGWHGEYVRCYPRNAKELSEEEQASYNWLRRHTSPCPTCSSPVQKTHGCNHMVCFQCRTHFCYLCSHWLDPDNPYQHFNTEGTPCYMRLWELEEGDGAEGNERDAFAGGLRGWEADAVAVDEADARALQAEEDAAGAAAVADGHDQHPPGPVVNPNPVVGALQANGNPPAFAPVPNPAGNPIRNPPPAAPIPNANANAHANPAPPRRAGPELQLVIGMDALRLAEEQQRALPARANANPVQEAPAAAPARARQNNHPNPRHNNRGPRGIVQRNAHGRQQPPAVPGRMHARRGNVNNQQAMRGNYPIQNGRRGGGRGGGAGPRGGRGGGGGGIPNLDGHISDGDDEPAVVARGGGGEGDPGLQRFLRMVVADEEDGWDSDELDGEDQAYVIPVRE